MTDWGEAVFNPRAVALVGASAKPGKLGNVVMRNLVEQFAGQVHPVHPVESAILGRPAYPNLRSVPGQVDLAVIATPPDTVLPVIEDCAAAGVAAAVILTGGFAEIGSDGRAWQERIAAAARAGRVRLIGPNCFGVMNAHTGFNASIAIGLPEAGGVSLFTQSGAYGIAPFSRSKVGGLNSQTKCNTGMIRSCDGQAL